MTDIADRLWSAVCEMHEANNRVLLKDEFCQRVREVLAASEAEVEIKPDPRSPEWRDPANGDVSDAAWAPEEMERIWSRPARVTVINRIKR